MYIWLKQFFSIIYKSSPLQEKKTTQKCTWLLLTVSYKSWIVVYMTEQKKLCTDYWNIHYCIGCVMVSSAVDRGIKPRSCHTKDNKISVCYISAQHVALGVSIKIGWHGVSIQIGWHGIRIMCPCEAIIMSKTRIWTSSIKYALSQKQWSQSNIFYLFS